MSAAGKRARTDGRERPRHHAFIDISVIPFKSFVLCVSPGGRREDDWTCPSCENVNFSFRTTCNMRNCTQSRPADHNVVSMSETAVLSHFCVDVRFVPEGKWCARVKMLVIHIYLTLVSLFISSKFPCFCTVVILIYFPTFFGKSTSLIFFLPFPC